MQWTPCCFSASGQVDCRLLMLLWLPFGEDSRDYTRRDVMARGYICTLRTALLLQSAPPFLTSLD